MHVLIGPAGWENAKSHLLPVRDPRRSRITNEPWGVQVDHVGCAVAPQQGVLGAPRGRTSARPHLLAAGGALNLRTVKPAGVQVSDAGRAAAPQQCVIAAAGRRTRAKSHLLSAADPMSLRFNKSAWIEVYDAGRAAAP